MSETMEVLTGPFGSRAVEHGLTTQEIFSGNRLDIARMILQEYRDAGATVPVTPTFGAGLRGTDEPSSAVDLRQWNALAAQVTTDIFAGQKVYASLAPLLDTSGSDDDRWQSLGDAWASNRHRPQVQALREAGITRFLGEAFRYLDEGKALARLLEDEGADEFICSFEARNKDGGFPHQPHLRFEHIHHELVAATRGKMRVQVGINCANVDDCARVLEREPAGTLGAVYPNKAKVRDNGETQRFLALALSLDRTAQEEDELSRLRELLHTSEEELRALMGLCLEQRVRLIGICCGGTPDDVRLLRSMVDERRMNSPSSRVPVHA